MCAIRGEGSGVELVGYKRKQHVLWFRDTLDPRRDKVLCFEQF